MGANGERVDQVSKRGKKQKNKKRKNEEKD